MTESQRKSLALSEARTALNGLIEKRNKLPNDQDPTPEDVAAMDAATRKVTALETEYRAALVQETEAEQRRAAADPDGAELEYRRLLARGEMIAYVNEALTERTVTGAEAELRAAIVEGAEHGPADPERVIPLELLLHPEVLETRARNERRLETRADAVTPVADAALADGSQASILERVFARSIAARLGVAMPSVPIGAAVYPIMVSGTTASMAADGTAVDAAAGSFTGHTLEPTRLTAAYLFNSRQAFQLRNFEAVLRRDLAAVMTDAMDDQIVNGNGTAPNVTGFLHELTAPTGLGSASTWANIWSTFTGSVDGLNAYGMRDLRAVWGKDSFQHAAGLFRGNNTETSAAEYVAERIGGLSVSSRIPAKDSNNRQNNIMALTSYPGRNAVAPVWRGAELIRDQYTHAAKAQVRLTMISYFNFKILRATGWNLWQVRTA